jgi:Metallo-peptidase family M12B Reprolysin-like
MKAYLLSLLMCLSWPTTILSRAENEDEGVFVSRAIMAEFKSNQGIKAEYDDLPLQAITAENTVTLPDGAIVSLDDLTPRSYFSESATCFNDGQPAPCPEPTVLTKMEEATGLQVIVSMDGEGEIMSIMIGEQGSGKYVTLVGVAPGIVTHIPFEAFDREFYQNFEFADPVTPRDTNNRRLQHEQEQHIRHRIREQVNNVIDEKRQKQQEGQEQPSSQHYGAAITDPDAPLPDIGFCDEVREVEVAVAVESIFCFASGGPLLVQAIVNNIMSNVAHTYEVGGLCFTAKIVHYEQYCDLANDPYQEGFSNNSAGCGKTGVLQAFESYWDANRQDVQRDAAILLSGRCLQLSVNGCSVIGCAYVGASCRNVGQSYGVTHVGYTVNPLFRAYLVSHELGHILGTSSFHSTLHNYIHTLIYHAHARAHADKLLTSSLSPS